MDANTQICENVKKRLKNIIYPKLSPELNSMFFEVHNELGPYCREGQYCDAIEKLLRDGKIKYARECAIKSDNNLIKDNSNRADFIIENKIVIEVKAVRFVGRSEYNQMQRYLRAASLKLGIIVNFPQRYLIPKKIINSNAKE